MCMFMLSFMILTCGRVTSCVGNPNFAKIPTLWGDSLTTSGVVSFNKKLLNWTKLL